MKQYEFKIKTKSGAYYYHTGGYEIRDEARVLCIVGDRNTWIYPFSAIEYVEMYQRMDCND